MSGVLPITVVIPAFNAAAYLAEALDSVSAQERRPAETIVVDDGSTDDTADIARRCGVRVITQPNGGIARARNAGITAAAMPWVAFLDADDRWLPQRLSLQWLALERCPGVEIASCDYSVFGDPLTLFPSGLTRARNYRRLTRKLGDGRHSAGRRLGDDAVLLDRRMLGRALVHGYFLQPATLLAARRLLTEAPVLFTPREELPSGAGFHIGEDYEWMLRALRHSDVVVVERPLVEYRRSPASVSADNAGMRLGDIMLGDHVTGRSDCYVEGVAAAFARARAVKFRNLGWGLLAIGDVVRADAMLARAVRDGDRLALPLAAVTRAFTGRYGRKAFAALWLAWRKWLRPLVHPARRSA